jgi:dolichyl-diphosphooligosaccharide--protein glycosyltransferase
VTRNRNRDTAVLGAVALLAAGLRSYYFPTVFRRDDVLLIQVDPWRYRFQLERLTEQARSPLDVAAFVDPGRDDLMVATLGWIAELLGGSAGVVGTLLAVYPVVAAVGMCLVVYAAARWLTDDRRVGLAAAGMLAITPAHVYRTALGFGDHHAFDYLWLAVTFALTVYLLRGPETTRERWLATGALGVSLAAQALAWVGGVLLVAPYTGVVLLVLLSTTRTEESPLTTVGPLVAALGGATVLTGAGTVLLSWQSVDVVILLAVATVSLGVLLAVCAAGKRTGRPAATAGGVVVSLVLLVPVVLWRVPTATDTLQRGLTYFEATEGVVLEATPLFSGGDPLGTVLSFFGLLGLVFVPFLLWHTWRSVWTHRPGWLAVTTYAWYFLGLSEVQRRFAGEFALFFAVVTGAGIVSLLHRVNRTVETRRTDPPEEGVDPWAWTADLRSLFAVTLVTVFLVSATIVQVPLVMDGRTVTDAEYETTQEIEAYADERGWEGDEGYVFSRLQSNLMYNYYAHGEEVTFIYASRNFDDFAASSDEGRWYRELKREGTGFVVVSDEDEVDRPAALGTRLQRNVGSARGSVDGLGRYRVVYRSVDGSVTAYALVEGALLAGRTEPNRTARVTTRVDAPAAPFTYERRPAVTDDGRYGVVVPYAGDYQLGDRTVTVSEEAVRRGATVGATGSTAYWALDEGRGGVLFDRAGGHHALAEDVQWVPGVQDDALSVTRESRVTVRDLSGMDTRDGFTVSLWVRTREDVDYRESVQFPRLVSTAGSVADRPVAGYRLYLSSGEAAGAVGDGDEEVFVSGPAIDDGRWHHVAMTWDGETLRLFVDGERYGERAWAVAPTPGRSLAIGASTEQFNRFSGFLDEVRIRDEAVSPARLREEASAGRNATASRVEPPSPAPVPGPVPGPER